MNRRLRVKAVVVAPVGVACLVWGGWLALRQHQLISWPTTKATVLSFEEGVDPTWDGHWYANPKIRFRYEIDGRTYESSRMNPSWFNYQSETRFRRDTSNFVSGATITVSYNPNDPAVSYAVSTGVTAAPVILSSVGIAVLFLELIERRFGRGEGGDSGVGPKTAVREGEAPAEPQRGEGEAPAEPLSPS